MNNTHWITQPIQRKLEDLLACGGYTHCYFKHRKLHLRHENEVCNVINMSPGRSLSLPCQLQSQWNHLYCLKVSYYYLRQDLIWFRLASNSLYSKGDLEPLPCSPFWERVSLYNPGYPETCYTDQAGLESRDPPVPHQVHLSSVGMKGMRQHTQNTQPTLPTLKLVRGGNLCLWAMGFRYLPPHCIYELWRWSLSLYMCAEKLKSQDFKLKKLGCIARCDDTHL